MLCFRCVCCITCGATTPGTSCQWQNNYSQCGPCASVAICPLCHRYYRDEEMIILCLHCDRWLHANCDGILTEDDAERAADFGYNCWFCRPITGHPGPCKLCEILNMELYKPINIKLVIQKPMLVEENISCAMLVTCVLLKVIYRVGQ